MDIQYKEGFFSAKILVLAVAAFFISGPASAGAKDEASAADAKALQAGDASVVMNSSLFGLCFTSRNNGWLVGKSGAIVCTRDGGKTWTFQKSGGKLHVYDVSFCDDAHGWAVGESGIILHTANGGASWETQQSGITGTLRAVQCLDAGTAWVAGHEGALLKTVDGGKTWVLQTKVQDMLKQLNRKFLPSFFGLKFSDALNGYTVGHPGIILRTTDGGETWHQQPSGTSSILYKVAVQGNSDAWISGGEGVILRTRDAGATWVLQTSGVSFKLNSIAFAGGNTGFAVGHKCILHTENGGETWSKFDIDLSRWLYGISFDGSNNGWAVGDSGTMYHTEDGGKSWNLISAQVTIQP
ncbi:MAG: YCF48-related protein [Pseudomonadota bacterium]